MRKKIKTMTWEVVVMVVVVCMRFLLWLFQQKFNVFASFIMFVWKHTIYTKLNSLIFVMSIDNINSFYNEKIVEKSCFSLCFSIAEIKILY